MTDYTPPTDTDFDGCNRKCRAQQRHTMEYGRCEHADKPEPTVSMSKICTGPDGYPSIGYDQYTVPQLAELIEPALTKTAPGARREIPEMAAEAARAIVHRNDGPAVPAALPSIHANDVEGFCPACGHGVLMLGDGGHVVCTLMDCPRPEAADELLRNVAVPSAPAGRAGLRDLIRRAVCEAEGFAWDADMLEPDEYGHVADAVLAKLGVVCICGHAEAQHFEDVCQVCDCGDFLTPAAAREVIARYQQAVKREPAADRAAAERLSRVLEWASSEAVTAKTEFGNGYRECQRDIRDLIRGRFDNDAANELRRLVDEAEREEPVRCPLCADARVLDTPAEAREHFTTVHPEERLVGSGPWPLLANRADEAQQQQPRRVKVRVVAVTKSPALLDTPDDEIAALCADEAQQQADTETRPHCPHCQLPHDLEPGSLPVAACESIRARIAEAGHRHAEDDHGGCAAVDCEVALLRLTLDAVEEGRRELRSDNARLRSQLWTLTAIFEGFARLLATSSRDWGQYAPDAWLCAVICGWDCEEPVHDETCTHGAMEEMQQRHGWDDETVAKARRYRAAVRAVVESGKEA